MSHDSHSTHKPEEKKPTVPFRSSFWLVVILAGLFIAAVNFVSVMSHDEGGHNNTEHKSPAHNGGQVTAPAAAEHHDMESHDTEATTEEHH